MAEAAEAAGRSRPSEVIQYAPCAIETDGREARRLAKNLVGGMLSTFWRGGKASPATQSALRDYNGLEPADFCRMISRLDSGERGETVLPDRVAAHYSVAGTPRECLEGVQAYQEAGVTELGVWFAADRAIASIERLGAICGGSR
jgi:alkanesulfonate monooxygenase SsuD/methylene tetrahydromethanopterin reductase-like flavin-dependent oxidoreductase (luciferase family)